MQLRLISLFWGTTLIMFSLITNQVFSQNTDSLFCGTEATPDSLMELNPWHGNNAYLYELLDSLGYAEAYDPYLYPASKNRFNWSFSEIPNTEVIIPIQFHIHDNAQGIRGPQEAQIQFMMDQLNYFYSGGNQNIRNFQRWNSQMQSIPPILTGIDTRIRFYQVCNLRYRYNDVDANISRDREARHLHKNFSIDGAVNVHMPNQFNVGAPASTYSNGFGTPQFIGMGGVAFGLSNEFLNYFSNNQSANPSSLSHEMGHFFGLDHTHRHYDHNKCGQEAVRRDRVMRHLICARHLRKLICEVNGDDLCDTPADRDNIDHCVTEVDNANNNRTCTYDQCPGLEDLYKDSYQNVPPDVYNIMSYHAQFCRRRFSWSQLAVMRHGMRKNTSENGVLTSSSYYFNACRFDRYEPDNNFRSARPCTIDVPQHHSFHWQVPTTTHNVSLDCDEDWVQFTVTAQTGILAISTEEALFSPANTIIELFRQDPVTNALVPIANDDDSNGNGFSRLIDLSLVPGRYFLRITKKGGLPSNNIADYYLFVRRCIPLAHCYSDTIESGEDKRYAAENQLTAPCAGDLFEVRVDGTGFMHSQQNITLKPGFRAVAGSHFTARIKPVLSCDDNRTFAIGKREPDPPFWPVTYPERPATITQVFPGAKEYARSLGLSDEEPSVPETPIASLEPLKLYPNPHRSSFSAELTLVDAGNVKLELHDLTGRFLMTLFAGELEAGTHLLEFNPELPADVYLCHLTANGQTQTHKLFRTE